MNKLRALLGYALTRRDRAVIYGILFIAAFAYPFLSHFGQGSVFTDWDFATELAWVPYWTLRHFHQLPLWNPYKCGGMPMWGNSQARFLSPFFALTLALGPDRDCSWMRSLTWQSALQADGGSRERWASENPEPWFARSFSRPARGLRCESRRDTWFSGP